MTSFDGLSLQNTVCRSRQLPALTLLRGGEASRSRVKRGHTQREDVRATFACVL